jgi:Peptidase_C39 like family
MISPVPLLPQDQILTNYPPAPPNPAKETTSIFDSSGESMPLYDQGESNACGTTSLAMVLAFLGGHDVDRHAIDAEIRRGDNFSSPLDLVEFARNSGVQAEMYNHGSPDELADFVDRGVPVQLLINNGSPGDPSQLHYVVVTGYRVDGDGERSFTIQDPGGAIYDLSEDDLQERWGSVPGGFDQFFIAYSGSGEPLPPSRVQDITALLGAVDGAAGVVNALDRLGHADSPASFGQAVGEFTQGVAQVAVGGALGSAQLGLGALAREAEKVPGPGVLAANVLGGIQKALAAVAPLLINTVDSVAETAAAAAEGVVAAVATVAEAVSEAVTQAANAVGKLFRKLF